MFQGAKFQTVILLLTTHCVAKTYGDNICGRTFEVLSGQTRTVNYLFRSGANYPANQNCVFYLRGTGTGQLTITFTTFDLEHHSSCGYDYLQVYDGPSTSSHSLNKLCGSEVPAPIKTTGNRATLKFVSDGNVQESGFVLQFANDGEEITTTTGSQDRRSESTTTSYMPYIWTSPTGYPFPTSETITEIDSTTVYATQSNDLLNLGCWKDTENRAILNLYMEQNSVQDCANAAKRLGYTVFAVQYRGECYSAENAKLTYKTYGPSSDCQSDGRGGDWANQVYEIVSTTASYTTSEPMETTATVEYRCSRTDEKCVFPFEWDGGTYNNECVDGILGPWCYTDGSAGSNGWAFCKECPELTTAPYTTSEPMETTATVDIDECTTGTDNCSDNAICTNNFGSYTCACNSGYSGDGVTCHDIDECFAGTDNCGENAFCTNNAGSFTCACNPGYNGDGASCHAYADNICGRTFDVLPGQTRTVSYLFDTEYPAGQNCVFNLRGTGTGGLNISFTTFDLEVARRCGYDYLQVYDGPSTTSYSLNKLCGSEVPSPIKTTGNRATLKFYSDGSVQKSGFVLKFAVVDIDECIAGTDNCSDNAVCTKNVGSFTCACNSGYTGNGVTCHDIDECNAGTDNCDENAVCTNNVGSYNCACNSGYTGNGVTCHDIDECNTGTDNSGDGHSGDGVPCHDSDECNARTDSCSHNAVCTNSAGSYTCACNSGYNGDGVTCHDVDECTDGADNCDDNATCTNNNGSFTCACNSGYTGDGVTCHDIDECIAGTDNCDENATCTNNNGSYTCACNSGYSGDGVTCHDIDEYIAGTDNCDENATCTNNNGSFSCACNSGYNGDGVTCHEYRCSRTEEKCVFPFEYGGATYNNECVDGLTGYWCRTDGSVGWAYCKECPESTTAPYTTSEPMETTVAVDLSTTTSTSTPSPTTTTTTVISKPSPKQTSRSPHDSTTNEPSIIRSHETMTASTVGPAAPTRLDVTGPGSSDGDHEATVVVIAYTTVANEGEENPQEETTRMKTIFAIVIPVIFALAVILAVVICFIRRQRETNSGNLEENGNAGDLRGSSRHNRNGDHESNNDHNIQEMEPLNSRLGDRNEDVDNGAGGDCDVINEKEDDVTANVAV